MRRCWRANTQENPQMLRKLIQGFGLLAICILLPSFSAHATEAKTVSLTKDGNAVEAILELPAGGGGETVTSLQLSMQINATDKALSVSFDFDEALKSSVQIATYQESTGTLNLYISGSQNLFAKDTLSLGKVILDAAPSDSVTATVRVNADSFQTVNAAFGAEKETLNAPAVITVAFGSDNADNGNPDTDDTNPNPDTPGADNGSQNPVIPGNDTGAVPGLSGGDPPNSNANGANSGNAGGNQNTDSGQIISGKNDTTPKIQPPSVIPNTVLPNLVPSVNTTDAPIQITELGGKKGITVTANTSANQNTGSLANAAQSGNTNSPTENDLLSPGENDPSGSLYGDAQAPGQTGSPAAPETKNTGTFPQKTLFADSTKGWLSHPALRVGIFVGVFFLVIAGIILVAYITGTKGARRRKKARAAQAKGKSKKRGKSKTQKKAPSGARSKKR